MSLQWNIQIKLCLGKEYSEKIPKYSVHCLLCKFNLKVNVLALTGLFILFPTDNAENFPTDNDIVWEQTRVYSQYTYFSQVFFAAPSEAAKGWSGQAQLLLLAEVHTEHLLYNSGSFPFKYTSRVPSPFLPHCVAMSHLQLRAEKLKINILLMHFSIFH